MLRTPKKVAGRRHEPYSPSPAGPSPRFFTPGRSPAVMRPPPPSPGAFCFRNRRPEGSPAPNPSPRRFRLRQQRSPSPTPVATNHAPRGSTDRLAFDPTLDHILEEAHRASDRAHHQMDPDNLIFLKELDRLAFKTDIKTELFKQRAISKRAEATAPAKIAQRDAECFKQWRLEEDNARKAAAAHSASPSRGFRFSAPRDDEDDEVDEQDVAKAPNNMRDGADDVFGSNNTSSREHQPSDADRTQHPRLNFDSDNDTSGSDRQSSPSKSTPNTSPAASVRTADSLWSHLEEERARLTAERQALDAERSRLQKEEATTRSLREAEALRVQEEKVAAIRVALEQESRRLAEETEAAIRAAREEEALRAEEERRRLQEELDRVREQMEAERLQAEYMRSRLEEQQSRTVEEEERLRALHQETIRAQHAAQEQARVEELRRAELEARLQAEMEATARAEAGTRRLVEERARREAQERAQRAELEMRARAEAEDAARRYEEYLRHQRAEQEQQQAFHEDSTTQPHPHWQDQSHPSQPDFNEFNPDMPMRERSFMDASMHSVTDDMDYDESPWDDTFFAPLFTDGSSNAPLRPPTPPVISLEPILPTPQPDPLPPLTPMELYNRKWQVLLDASTPQTDLQLWQLPWPVLHEVRGPEDITELRVTEFVHQAHLLSPHEDFKAVTRREMLRYHPDKFKSRMIHQVYSDDWPAVEEAAKVSTRILLALRRTP